MRVRIIILLLFLGHLALAQIDTTKRIRPSYYYYFSIDTTEFYSRKIKIYTTLRKTYKFEAFYRKIGDLIFNDNANKVSQLNIIKNHSEDTIVVSTIPINHIIIDDSNELIIGLSRAVLSPYQLVLYNFNGELLFKKKLSRYELALDSLNYRVFCDSFPEFYEYAKSQNQILRADKLYYVDLVYWSFLPENIKEKIKSYGWVKETRYFPALQSWNSYCSPICLSQYENFYSQTDPFYEFEAKDSILTGIVLNDEYGGKVRIPIFPPVKIPR